MQCVKYSKTEETCSSSHTWPQRKRRPTALPCHPPASQERAFISRYNIVRTEMLLTSKKRVVF